MRRDIALGVGAPVEVLFVFPTSERRTVSSLIAVVSALRNCTAYIGSLVSLVAAQIDKHHVRLSFCCMKSTGVPSTTAAVQRVSGTDMHKLTVYV